MKQTYFKIPGWFNYAEAYDQIVDQIPDDGKIVEIGSFLGRSTHYLATSLMNANKEQVKIYCVDTFEGSSEHISLKLPKDFLFMFKENLKFFIGREMVIPCQGRSDDKNLINKFEDESIDYIMVDGAHEHEAVMEDIENWYPKLKKEGLMLGDDYNLEAVSLAVDKAIQKINAPAYTVNRSLEATWFTTKSNKQAQDFEKLCPGLNCLI
jgi:predicted O-methyltransferase YrrM